MQEQTPLELTTAALAELWSEIALYLEIWDLIQEGVVPVNSAA